jgi:hypothetical protein
VIVYLLVTLGWPFLVLNTTQTSGPHTPIAALSPVMVAADFVGGLAFRTNYFRGYMSSVILWDILVAVVAIALLEWTVRSFDRCLGRMPVRTAPWGAHPAKHARAVTPPNATREAGANTFSRPPAATCTAPA